MPIRIQYDPDVALLGQVAGQTGKGLYDERAIDRLLRLQAEEKDRIVRQNQAIFDMTARINSQVGQTKPIRLSQPYGNRQERIQQALDAHIGREPEASPELQIAREVAQGNVEPEAILERLKDKNIGLEQINKTLTGLGFDNKFQQNLFLKQKEAETALDKVREQQQAQAERQQALFGSRTQLQEEALRSREQLAFDEEYRRRERESYKTLTPSQRREMSVLDQQFARTYTDETLEPEERQDMLAQIEDRRQRLLELRGPEPKTPQQQFDDSVARGPDGSLWIPDAKGNWKSVNKGITAELISKLYDQALNNLTSEAGVKPSPEAIREHIQNQLSLINQFMGRGVAAPEELVPMTPESAAAPTEQVGPSAVLSQDPAVWASIPLKIRIEQAASQDVPIPVLNRQEAITLPPGSMFRTPDGRVFRVPRKQ